MKLEIVLVLNGLDILRSLNEITMIVQFTGYCLLNLYDHLASYCEKERKSCKSKNLKATSTNT